jgi:N-acetylmuramic acid 6-phosphate etherase
MKSTKNNGVALKTFLGIDGGGTRTVALSVNASGEVVRRIEAGPANVKLLTDGQLVTLFRSLARALPKPAALGIGLAGAWAETDACRVHNVAAKVWPGIPCHATNDLEIALLAATELARGNHVRKMSSTPAQILVVSGTGSCAFSKLARGRDLKIGGWGHVLGDHGSAYQIGLNALKASVAHFDREGHWSKLGEQLLRALQLNEPTELIDWVQDASKAEIAQLAVEIFAAWDRGDKLAGEILDQAIRALSEKALICARRVARRGTPIQFLLAGSVLLKQPRFARSLARQLRRGWPAARVTKVRRESAWGAVALARRLSETNPATSRSRQIHESETPSSPRVSSTRMSPTEQRNPRSLKLDRLSLADGITLMIREDALIHRALLAQRGPIEQALRLIVKAFQQGGRLFYVGAGTSGRLGVLDASECPVTFRTSSEQVQAIIAGGQTAFWKPVEGAEDDALAGARAVAFRGVTARDVVLGIAASGTTPFVWGALQAARSYRAKTILLAFNPFVKIPRAMRPEVCILPNLGPEVLTGSTRLKAGAATKLVLNTLTTLAMVRLGKVSSNLMVDLVPTNVKLRDRAIRIVQALTGQDYASAQAALQASGWVIKRATARRSRR